MISGTDKQGCFLYRKLLFRMLRKMHTSFINITYWVIKFQKEVLRNHFSYHKMYNSALDIMIIEIFCSVISDDYPAPMIDV